MTKFNNEKDASCLEMTDIKDGTRYYDYHKNLEIEYVEADNEGPHRLEIYENGILNRLVQRQEAKELYHILTGGNEDETLD